MAKIDEYMASFSKEIGLSAPIGSDLPGVYMFSVGEDVPVSVVDKNGTLIASASFGPVPSQQKEAFYTYLLTADLFYQGTEKSVLGINAADNKIVVRKIIDRDITANEFIDEMEDFLNTLEVWRERSAEFH